MKVRRQEGNDTGSNNTDLDFSQHPSPGSGAGQRRALGALAEIGFSRSDQVVSELGSNSEHAAELGDICSLLYLNAQIAEANNLLQQQETLEKKLAALSASSSISRVSKNMAKSLAYKQELNMIKRNISALVDEFTQSTMGESPLFIAARTGQTELLALFETLGIDLNSRNAQGQTLISAAIEAGQSEGLSWLLQQGLDPDAADDRGQAPLFLAVERNQTDAIKLLEVFPNKRGYKNTMLFVY